MANLSITEFWGVCAQIVRAYPATTDDSAGTDVELTCKRPQVFAVVRSEDEIAAENLAKTANYAGKDYFFSRTWEDAMQQPSGIGEAPYPRLCAWSEAATMTPRSLDKKRGERQTRVQFALLDLETRKQGACESDACAMRNFEEIESDLAQISERFIRALRDMVKTNTYGWASNAWLRANAPAEPVLLTMDSCLLVENIEFRVFHQVYRDNCVGLFFALTVEIADCAELIATPPAILPAQAPDLGCN